MTVSLDGSGAIRLEGSCSAEDAETLLQLLLAHPAAVVDWRHCEGAHGAVVQVLLVAKRTVLGPAASSILNRFVAPAIGSSG